MNREMKLPAISEVKARFGESLSSIFFDFLADEEKEEIGLIPRLQGPENSSLWVSPNDSSNGTIKLTTFEDDRCQKALTHQNILNIGKTIENEKSLENDRKLKEAKDYAVRETIKFLTKRKEDKEISKPPLKGFCDKSTLYDIEVDCTDTETKQPNLESDKELPSAGLPGEDNKDVEQSKNELNESTSQTSNNSSSNEPKNYNQELEAQMQQALIEREQYIMKKMNFQMLWESEKQHEVYKSKIKEAHKKWISLYNKAKLSFEKETKQMKFEMEARQLADMMKIHERKMLELKTLKEIMERHFYGIVDSQRIEVKKREKIIKDLMELTDTREKTLRNWELKVSDIMKDFQNLMKFIMVETPNQTEFLIDFEQIFKETLQVPQPSPVPACASSIENEIPDGLTLEGINQFLIECDNSIGQVYSTTVEVIRQNNEFDIAFDKICTEIQLENMILDEHEVYDKDMTTLDQQFEKGTVNNSRLDTILNTLKRHPSLQRIVISTHIANK